MNHITHTRIFLIIFLAYCNNVVAQEFNPYKNVTLPSPTAVQFQKFIDVPVGKYTGTPVINIPLYTVNAANIQVPIVLMHHASGIKLTEHASWVGAGWSLSAGGMITRSVNGAPDFEVWYDDLDEFFTPSSDPNENQPPSGATGRMWVSYFESTEVAAVPTLLPGNQIDYLNEVLISKRDAQPDVYYFNFLGMSGKFFFDQDGNIITNPNDKIKISKPTNLSPYWVVTDNKGTKYTFGSVANSREFSIGFKDVDYVSSWYLDKIETVGGNTVNFNYTVAGSFTTVPILHSYDYQAQYNRTSAGGGSTVANITYSKVNTFKPVKLTSITFNGDTGSGSVIFTSSQTRNDSYQSSSYLTHYKLDEIKVRNGNDAGVYRFDFEYDNLSNNLWLESVTKKYYNDDGSSIVATDLPYVFTYDSHTSLPSSKSYSVDYWGYYNGKSNGTSLLPKVAYGKVSGSQSYGTGADRSASLTYAKYGSLIGVSYPTGASTAYEYELNSFSGFSGQGAGLRVKTMTISDGLGSPDMVTAYQYVDPASGSAPSGVLLAPMFTHANVMQHYSLPAYSRANVRVSHPFNLGGHQAVGYGTVVELQGASGENGRAVYYFDTANPGFANVVSNQQYQYEMLSEPYYFNSNLNGKLKKVQIQNNTGSGFSTLKETEYQYNLNTESLKTHGLIANAYIGTSQAGGIEDVLISGFSPDWEDVAGFLIYQVKTNWYNLSKIIEKGYVGANAITKTTDLTYYSNSARELKNYVYQNKETYTDGKLIETQYTYPFNTGGTVYATMTTNHQVPTISEYTFLKEGATYHKLGGSVKVFASVTSNNPFGIETRTRPLLTELYEIKKESSTSSAFSQRLVRKVNHYSYYGRVLEEEDANGIPTAYIYYLNTLLAKVYNAKADEVYYENYEYGLSPGETHNPSIAFTGSQYGASVAPSIGAPSSNKYLTYWKRIGSTWTFFKEDYTGQSYISAGTFDDARVFPKDAQMITYSYKPLIGASVESDMNNRPAIYVYDDRNRVIAIKDHYGNVIKAFKQTTLAN